MPKRKAGEGVQKYYAVRVGVAPGVYRTWPECQAQITGFRGATYKAFETQEDAIAFVAGRTPPSENSKKAKANQPAKFYAVASGRKPGIYTDWDTAQREAIIGVKGPKYKKFGTRAEAENYIRLHGSLETITSLGLLPDVGKDDDGDEEEEEDMDVGPSIGTKIKAGKGDVKVMKIPPGVAPPEAGLHDGVLHIYTDGSSLSNGKTTARAGVGVFFGHSDARNISEKLEGSPQTNQRAELAAILRALEIAPVDQDVMIITDSSYSINCLTTWNETWIKNGWRTAKGDMVMNRDLIKKTLARIEERNKAAAETEFEWVKGHAQSPGNIAADALAVKGSRGW